MSTAEHDAREEECSDSEDYEARIRDLDQVIQNAFIEFHAHEATDEAKQEYFRKRNALYSQRKYYRRKQRIKNLADEKKSLLQKNAALRTQNTMLETLLSWAQHQVQVQNTGTSLPTTQNAGQISAVSQPNLMQRTAAARPGTQQHPGQPMVGGTTSQAAAAALAAFLAPSAAAQDSSLLTSNTLQALAQHMGSASSAPTVSPSQTVASGSDQEAAAAPSISAPTQQRPEIHQGLISRLLEELSLIDRLLELIRSPLQVPRGHSSIWSPQEQQRQQQENPAIAQRAMYNVPEVAPDRRSSLLLSNIPIGAQPQRHPMMQMQDAKPPPVVPQAPQAPAQPFMAPEASTRSNLLSPSTSSAAATPQAGFAGLLLSILQNQNPGTFSSDRAASVGQSNVEPLLQNFPTRSATAAHASASASTATPSPSESSATAQAVIEALLRQLR